MQVTQGRQARPFWSRLLRRADGVPQVLREFQPVDEKAGWNGKGTNWKTFRHCKYTGISERRGDMGGDELSGGPREGAGCWARCPSAFLAPGTALGLGLVPAAKGG